MDEITVFQATLCGLGFVFVFHFIRHYICSDYKIYSELEAHNLILQRKISKLKNKEDLLKNLSDFCIEGKDLYFNGFNDEKSKTEWDKNKIQWSKSVEIFIEKNINISTLHAFKNTKYSTMHFTSDSLNNDYASLYFDDIQDFSGKIDMLEEYIQTNESGWRNDLNDNT